MNHRRRTAALFLGLATVGAFGTARASYGQGKEAAALGETAAEARALRPGIEIEATGGIGPANVAAFAEAGADFVSIGALTHSVRAADIGLEVE